MANSLGTIGASLIAQKGLEYLAAQYPIIGSICNDVSDASAVKGQSIISNIPSVGALADFDETNGYVAQPATGTSVTVTLDNFKHSSFSFSDGELSSTNSNLLEQYSQSFAETIGQGVMSAICAKFVTGTFLNSTVMALTGCTVQNVINTPNTNLNKRNVPKQRFGIFNSDYYGALYNDDQMVNLTKGGNGIGSESLPVVHGVTLSDYSALPTTSNLVGVVGHKSALVFASRLPSDVGYAGLPEVARISNVTDPKTGLSVQVREFYNAQLGKVQVTYALIFGVAVADQTRIQLVRSA